MKIHLAQIPPEGSSLTEDIPPGNLDLGTDIIKFREFVQVKAFVYKITNAVTFDLEVNTRVHCLCSRCVEEFIVPLNKQFKFSFPVDRSIQSLDLDPEIRQELMLDLPVRLLCKPDCQGLCVKCGKNLNLGKCSCLGQPK
jgi:uncharacterized protein